MGKVPFAKFIATFLLFNKSIGYIIEKLKEFGYSITEDEVSRIFKYIRNCLPEKYRTLVESHQPFDINNPEHVEWLKHFGVFEFYDFIIRQNDDLENAPDYFNWCLNCMWIHGYRDVMSLINILLFNKEPYEEISKIIMFKYRKKIGVDTLSLYENVFWNTSEITAKEAVYYCVPFRDNALIIRQIRGGAEVSMVDKSISDPMHDGSDVPFTFHDSSYIKWKIGYRDIAVPTSRDFLEQVKRDSYFKYYESFNMTQCVDVEKEDGHDDKLGDFEHNKVKHRNIEEQRAKMMKHYLDLYLKAEESMPSGGAKTEDFFKKMAQTQLQFDENEKMARIDDVPDILADIKGDMSDLKPLEGTP